MLTFEQKLKGAFLRVFPACVAQGQAVAFNMFLAFFPMLLFALGVLSSTALLKEAAEDLPDPLRMILPPGSHHVVSQYLVRRGSNPWHWIWLGLGGTLLAGTQVMIALMEGFRIVAKVPQTPKFWRRQLRALLLLCLIIGPWLAVVVLSMFGRQLRTWLIHEYGLPNLLQATGAVLYIGSVLVLGFGVVMVVYRVAGPWRHNWRAVVPGALVATVLWWMVDASFGFYVTHMPYGQVYGGLAAAIGLLIWMYLSAMVVFVGAAYNVESQSGVGIRRRAV
jgi:membrane protein